MINKTFKAICECGTAEGLIVFGAIRVQCPVWVLHLKMLSKDNDPFFAIDKWKKSDILTLRCRNGRTRLFRKALQRIDVIG